MRSQPTSFASPGARVSVSGFSGSGTCSTRPVRLTSIARFVALRTVNSERMRSPPRTSGAAPEKIIKSWVERIDVPPVPKSSAPPVATATMRNAVTESFRGISTDASPRSFNGTRPFQSSSVSNSSRVAWRPPPPP